MIWRVHLESLIRFGQIGYRMYVMRGEQDGRYSVINKLEMKTFEQYEAISYDDATLDDAKLGGTTVHDFLQAMSDAAWEIGIKPKQVEGHADELKAVRYHLEDMRRVAGVNLSEGG